MDLVLRDLRYVWRTLTRAPGFFVVTVATLGLGIGATTAIFSVVEGVLLRPLPYPRSERIVQIWQVNQKGNDFQFSDLNFRDVGADSRSLAMLAEYADNGTVSVATASDALRARLAVVSRDFFTVLGVQPVLGRAFLPDEQQVGGESGDRSQALRLKGPPVETIKLEASIDAADQLEFPEQNQTTTKSGIRPQLAAIETIIYPPSSQLQSNNQLAQMGTLEIVPMQAPLLLLWGEPSPQPCIWSVYLVAVLCCNSRLAKRHHLTCR